MMDIINKIIPIGREEYKCYDLIKSLIVKNNDFEKIISEGLETKKYCHLMKIFCKNLTN